MCFEQCEDKIEFKNKFAEIAVLSFCEINDDTPGFYLVLSRHIHNPEKQIMEVFYKNSQRLNTVNYFCEKLDLTCFIGF